MLFNLGLSPPTLFFSVLKWNSYQFLSILGASKLISLLLSVILVFLPELTPESFLVQDSVYHSNLPTPIPLLTGEN